MKMTEEIEEIYQSGNNGAHGKGRYADWKIKQQTDGRAR